MSQHQNITSPSFSPRGNRTQLRNNQHAPKHNLRLVNTPTMVATIVFVAQGKRSPTVPKGLGTLNVSSQEIKLFGIAVECGDD